MDKTCKHIVFLTGAGISAESGLSTFRSEDGLWNKHRVEDVATIEAFERQPEYVHQFYNSMRPELFAAQPNAAHLSIARLQKELKQHKINIITQNVDTLHEKAGSNNIYHIHGQINQLVCLQCGHVSETWAEAHSTDVCPNCHTQGNIKPNIVFFGETPLCLDVVDNLLKTCDLFISVGTSGVVYPAAGFVQIAKLYGAETYEFNMEKTSNNYMFDHHIFGKAGSTLPTFIDELIAQYQ